MVFGKVIKAIDNVGLLHMQGTHERMLTLDLGKRPLLIVNAFREDFGIERKPKKYKLHTINQARGFT